MVSCLYFSFGMQLVICRCAWVAFGNVTTFPIFITVNAEMFCCEWTTTLFMQFLWPTMSPVEERIKGNKSGYDLFMKIPSSSVLPSLEMSPMKVRNLKCCASWCCVFYKHNFVRKASLFALHQVRVHCWHIHDFFRHVIFTCYVRNLHIRSKKI